MTNILNTLHALHHGSYHSMFVRFLHEPFTAFATAQAEFLLALATDQPTQITPAMVAAHQQRLDDTIAQAWKQYSLAREFVYGGLDSEGQEDAHAEMGREEGRPKRRRSGAAMEAMPSKEGEGGEPSGHLLATESLHPPPTHPHSPRRARSRLYQSASPHTAPCPCPWVPPSRFLPSWSLCCACRGSTASDLFHRSCFLSASAALRLAGCLLALAVALTDVLCCVDGPLLSFYLNQYRSALKLDFRFPSTEGSSADALSPGTAKRRAVKASLYRHVQHPLSWSLVGFHPVLDAIDLVRGTAEFLRRPNVDVTWLKASIKVSLIIATASVFSVVPALDTSSVFINAVWCTVRPHPHRLAAVTFALAQTAHCSVPLLVCVGGLPQFTAAIVTSDNEGALWQRGLHRLLGTLVGGASGWIILYAFPTSNVYAILLLSVWHIPCLFVQCSRHWSYLGSTAQLTAVVVVLGYHLSPQGLTPEKYAYVRVEEISIGVFIALGISSVLWPVSSIRLLRSEVMLSISSVRVALQKTESSATQPRSTRFQWLTPRVWTHPLRSLRVA